MAQGPGDGASPQRVQGRALAAGGRGRRMSEEGGSNLGAAGRGVGEHEASAETESEAGGFERVAAGGDVVHEIGLAERQDFAGAGQVVLIGGDGAKRQLVAGALGLHRLGAVDSFDNLSAGTIAGDVAGEAGVGVGVAGAVGDGDKPARAADERGHFTGGGVEVNRGAGGVLEGVGQAASLGLLKGERAIARGGVFAGGKDIHGMNGRNGSYGLLSPSLSSKRRRGGGGLI